MLQLNLFHHCSFSSQESKEKPELHTVFVFKKSIVQLAKIFNYFKTKTKKIHQQQFILHGARICS